MKCVEINEDSNWVKLAKLGGMNTGSVVSICEFRTRVVCGLGMIAVWAAIIAICLAVLLTVFVTTSITVGFYGQVFTILPLLVAGAADLSIMNWMMWAQGILYSSAVVAMIGLYLNGYENYHSNCSLSNVEISLIRSNKIISWLALINSVIILAMAGFSLFGPDGSIVRAFVQANEILIVGLVIPFVVIFIAYQQLKEISNKSRQIDAYYNPNDDGLYVVDDELYHQYIYDKVDGKKHNALIAMLISLRDKVCVPVKFVSKDGE